MRGLNVKMNVKAKMAFLEIGDTLIDTIRLTMDKYADLGYKIFVEKSPEWRGAFKRTVRVYKSYSPNGFSVTIGTPIPYGPVLDRGREPGTYPKIYPKLAQWAEDKGLNVYKVAHSIYKKGTKPKHILNKVYDRFRYMAKAAEKSYDETSIAKIEKILKEIGEELEDASK